MKVPLSIWANFRKKSTHSTIRLGIGREDAQFFDLTAQPVAPQIVDNEEEGDQRPADGEAHQYRLKLVVEGHHQQDPGDPELMDSEWRVMSQSYRLLNFREEDTSIPLERIQRRTIILLGQELHGRKKDLEDAMSSVLSMLFGEAEEGA